MVPRGTSDEPVWVEPLTGPGSAPCESSTPRGRVGRAPPEGPCCFESSPLSWLAPLFTEVGIAISTGTFNSDSRPRPSFRGDWRFGSFSWLISHLLGAARAQPSPLLATHLPVSASPPCSTWNISLIGRSMRGAAARLLPNPMELIEPFVHPVRSRVREVSPLATEGTGCASRPPAGPVDLKREGTHGCDHTRRRNASPRNSAAFPAGIGPVGFGSSGHAAARRASPMLESAPHGRPSRRDRQARLHSTSGVAGTPTSRCWRDSCTQGRSGTARGQGCASNGHFDDHRSVRA